MQKLRVKKKRNGFNRQNLWNNTHTQKKWNKNQDWLVQKKTPCYWKVMELFCDKPEELRGHPADSLTRNNMKEQNASVVLVLWLQN